MVREKYKPVLIVGGGPTGMMLAAELARRDIPCRIIDRREGPNTTSRAFTIHARTLEIFETIGLADRFVETGLKSNGFLFNFKGLEKKPVLDFRVLRSRYPFVLVYSQADTERVLREHLREAFGIEIEWNAELCHLEQGEEGVSRVEFRDRKSDQITSMEPSYVLGCDGVHSFVRKSLDLPFDGEAYEGMIMQMMDASVQDYDCDPDWVQYFMINENFLLTTPLPNGNCRVLISDMGETAKMEGSRVEAFQSVIDQHNLAFKVQEPEWITNWVIWKRLANAYRKQNVFLCGDSAHIHSPSGGQGMNSCLQDAWNLGWKLAMVLRGEARPELLDTYETERLPVAKQVIDGTDQMHDIIMAHGRGMSERMALTETPNWQMSVTELVAGISYTYRDQTESSSAADDMEDGPCAGDRAPDVELALEHRLFERFRHNGYTLILMPQVGVPSECNEASAIRDAVDANFGATISTFMASDEDVAALGEIYGSDGAGRLYLVRPDGYIAFRARLGDAEALTSYLHSVLITTN